MIIDDDDEWWMKEKQKVYLGGAGIFQVPKFDMPVAHRDKVGAIFGKRNGLHLRRYFIWGHFDPTSPVPHVDDHVVLGTHGDDILVIRWEGLHYKQTTGRKKKINIKDDKNRLQVVAKDEITANMTHTLQLEHFGRVTTNFFFENGKCFLTKTF